MLEKLTFTTKINASKQKVWNTLFEDKTYRVWTSEFTPGSYAVTDWQEGSKALFLSPEGSGMVSRIAKNIPNEFLSIEHIGVIKDGIEDLKSAEAEGWSGSQENYKLKEENGVTELEVTMDTTQEFKDIFADLWPRALKKLKEITE